MTLIARRPSRELIDLVGTLGGTWRGQVATCRCPSHPDRTPSLSLRQGHRGILVTCFAGCAAADVLRELRRIKPIGQFPDPACESLTGKVNIARLWEEGCEVRGTLGARYLAMRHLPVDLPDLRFHPRCPLGPKPRTVFKPALLVAVREGPRLTAVQRIFLDADTGGYHAKLMLGRPGSGSWAGQGGGATLAIAEGFESAAAFTILKGVPCRAALGARRLDQLSLPTNIEKLILALDADAEGRRAAAKAHKAYARADLTIEPAPPPAPFKDWADVLEAQMKRGGGSSE